MTEEEVYQRFLEWRNIEYPCEKCEGSGGLVYGSTSTWRHGIGGQTICYDVCDKCWGSGDKNKSWANLRTLYSQISRKDDR